MTVARFAVSFDRQLARAVKKAAAGQATSAWLADAARRKLRAEGLLSSIAEWESSYGTLSEAELKQAARRRSKRSR